MKISKLQFGLIITLVIILLVLSECRRKNVKKHRGNTNEEINDERPDDNKRPRRESSYARTDFPKNNYQQNDDDPRYTGILFSYTDDPASLNSKQRRRFYNKINRHNKKRVLKKYIK